MIEALALLLGRHLTFRGSGRLLQLMYPCRPGSKRYIRGVRTRSDGLKFDADTRQLIDWCMFFHGKYEPHVGLLFQRLVGPGSVVADVGANVGAHTLTLAKLVGAGGRVFAFEPNPAVRDRLVRNLAINSFENVVVNACALGDIDGQLSLRVPAATSEEFSNPGLASLVALDTPHDLVPVEVLRFDDIFHEAGFPRLDLVKIDVQGFEMNVLRGMEGAISQYHPAIVFEYEDWAWGKAGSGLQTVSDFLKSMSYRLLRVEAGSVLELTPVGVKNFEYSHMDLIAMHLDDHRLLNVKLQATTSMSCNGPVSDK